MFRFYFYQKPHNQFPVKNRQFSKLSKVRKPKEIKVSDIFDIKIIKYGLLLKKRHLMEENQGLADACKFR